MPSPIGAHVSNSLGLLSAAHEIHKHKGNIVQLFVSTTKNESKAKDELIETKTFMEKHKIKSVIHTSHLTNLSREWQSYSWWIILVKREIEYAGIMGSLGVVVHMGDALKLSQSHAINNMYSAIIYLIDQTHENYPNVNIFIETASGQGTQFGYELDNFINFFNKFKRLESSKRKRIKICIDTCHIFVAGNDMRTTKSVNKMVNKISAVGWDNIGLIHFNDSNKEFGSRIDRHAPIGKGYIGNDGLMHFAKTCMSHNIPIILETPQKSYRDEIPMLKTFQLTLM